MLAAQEVLPRQARLIRAALGSEYHWVGRGRSREGRGEGCTVFYDAARLELRSWQPFALSSTPEVPGSRSWGSVFPRIAVSAVFRDRSTGAEFRVVNTHLDPFSSRARSRAAGVILARLASSAEPVVVAGDLNAGPGSAAVEALQAGSTLVDAWQAATERLTPEFGTFANYRQPRAGRRIDWLLTTADVTVQRIAINAAQRDRWASLMRASGLSDAQAGDAIGSDAFGPLTAELRRAEAKRHDVDALLPCIVRTRSFGVRMTSLRFCDIESPLRLRDPLDRVETAIAEPAPWVAALGPEPSNEQRATNWRRTARVVAAFRDRYQINSASPPGALIGPIVQRMDHARVESALRRIGKLDQVNAQTRPLKSLVRGQDDS